VREINGMPRDNSEGYFHRLARSTTTQFWINNPTPEEAEAALRYGAVGATTNPTYFARMLKETSLYPARLAVLAGRKGASADSVYGELYTEAIGTLQAMFWPLYERSGGLQGYVAIQGDPRRNDDAAFITEEALGFRSLGDNMIIKVPSTPAGAQALRELTLRGVPTIATLGFSVDQAVYMAEVYRAAIFGRSHRPLCYVTFIAGILDEFLASEARNAGAPVTPESLKAAGCIATRVACRIFRERGYEALIIGGGARGAHHLTELVGGNLAVTIGFPIAREIAEADGPVMARIDAAAPAAALAELETLPTFRAASREGSLAPEEFRAFGPVARFQASFLEGVTKVLAAAETQRRTRS
jgi:transaldolase